MARIFYPLPVYYRYDIRVDGKSVFTSIEFHSAREAILTAERSVIASLSQADKVVVADIYRYGPTFIKKFTSIAATVPARYRVVTITEAGPVVYKTNDFGDALTHAAAEYKRIDRKYDYIATVEIEDNGKIVHKFFAKFNRRLYRGD